MISVIIPVYNVSAYVEKCIKSIINQTEKDLEIIIVNDGATDNSGTICKKYETIDKRVVYIEKENGGLSDARNAGLECAKGKYIMFVDGDDYIHPQMAELLLFNLLNSDADISVCDFKEVTETDIGDYKCINVRQDNCHEYIGDQVCKQLFVNNLRTVVAWNKLYKREIFDNIRYPQNVLHEDEYVIHEILFKAQKIVYSEKQLYYYLKRKGSITAEVSRKNINDGWKSLQIRKLFWLEKGQNNWYTYTLVQELFFIVSRYDKMKKACISNAEKKDFRRKFHKDLVEGDVNKILGKGQQFFLFQLFDRSPQLYYFYTKNENKISNTKMKIRKYLFWK